jgi:chemotaxis protein MotA
MDKTSLVGIVSGLLLIIIAILVGGDLHNFASVPGLMIVVGGTAAATLLTFPFEEVKSAFKGAWHVFQRPRKTADDIIAEMLDMAVVRNQKGIVHLSDIETESPFMQRAINLISEGSDEELIRNILRNEIDALKARHFEVQDVFRKMGTYAPAFGLLGTLIGLIQMLSTLSDPASIGPAMSVALLTTFYGSLLSTTTFLPIAGKLKARTLAEVVHLEIIYEGAIALLQDNNQLTLYERLSSFIPSSQRKTFQAFRAEQKARRAPAKKSAPSRRRRA